MKNNYTKIHYNEEIRPYSKYSLLFCENITNKYFKNREGKLLDFCCGRGEHLEIFQKLGYTGYGVDMDNFAKNKGLNIRIVNVEKDKLPFKNNFFDFIMAKSSIEHIHNIYHAMDELFRVLKKGGKIVILTCDWRKNYKIFFDDVDHKTPFTKYSLNDLLLRYDFKNVKVETFYHLPFTWKNKFYHIIPNLISFLIPIDFSPTVKFSPLIKLIKFSREKTILGYGEK
jgi:SAM-dependent methyltransferase